jgi:hypothetical protein
MQFIASNYKNTQERQACGYISNPEIPSCDQEISGLIQEFLTELIALFTQRLLLDLFLTQQAIFAP